MFRMQQIGNNLPLYWKSTGQRRPQELIVKGFES